MFKVYGVCSLDLNAVVKALKQATRKANLRIKVWVPHRELVEHDVVVFVGVEDFHSILRETMRTKLVFTPVIFDTELNLRLRGFEILDAKRATPEDVAKAVVSGPNILPNTKFYPANSMKPITDLIEETKKTARFLDGYSTLFYTLPKPVQQAVKQAVLNFMVGEIDEPVFDAKIARQAPKRGEAKAKFDKLLAMVKGPVAQSLRVAIARVLKGQKAKVVAEKMNLSAFDINYFIKLSTTKQKEDVLVTHGTKPSKIRTVGKNNVKPDSPRSRSYRGNEKEIAKRSPRRNNQSSATRGKRTSGRYNRRAGVGAAARRGRDSRPGKR